MSINRYKIPDRHQGIIARMRDAAISKEMMRRCSQFYEIAHRIGHSGHPDMLMRNAPMQLQQTSSIISSVASYASPFKDDGISKRYKPEDMFDEENLIVHYGLIRLRDKLVAHMDIYKNMAEPFMSLNENYEVLDVGIRTVLFNPAVWNEDLTNKIPDIAHKASEYYRHQYLAAERDLHIALKDKMSKDKGNLVPIEMVPLDQIIIRNLGS